VTNAYYETIILIERLHRRFLDVLKAELDRGGAGDINNIQALILYNIGRDELTVGELTARGHYLGSNVSYNVKKMVENGYLMQERSNHDRRTVRVRSSDRGLALRERLEQLFQRHVDALDGAELTQATLQTGNGVLRQLERFWSMDSGFAGMRVLDLA
jgi:DNA-binding MarR family transcriptional regulator